VNNKKERVLDKVHDGFQKGSFFSLNFNCSCKGTFNANAIKDHKETRAVTDDGRRTRTVSSSALTPQSHVQQPASRATGTRLMSRVTRDAATTLSSVGDAEKEKTWRIGGHEFSDGAYQQLLRWLCAIQSAEGPRTVDALVNHLQQSFDANRDAKKCGCFEF
jgi:hypothetical protein